MASASASASAVNGLSRNGLASNLILPNSSFYALPNSYPFHQIVPSASLFCSGLKKVNYLLRASSEEGLTTCGIQNGRGRKGVVILNRFSLLQIQQLLKDLEGEFLQVYYCTEDMIDRSLWDAVNSTQQDLGKLKIANSVPRICFLSGLSGEEMMMFIDAFEETDLEDAVFAAHVENSSNKPLRELIEEIMGDHEMVSARQPNSE
ncbi:uncharacterized protein [Spinacia oleracea]|uniref:Uncharacterized protein isoform X2 n=1 Tax=Spinacia oleracea TaxID=3562 RepID=A0A9R0JRR0_SPIOL|nr:uncharacterized protein LOC110784539 isoform X2 [Spinacia oleracea]